MKEEIEMACFFKATKETNKNIHDICSEAIIEEIRIEHDLWPGEMYSLCNEIMQLDSYKLRTANYGKNLDEFKNTHESDIQSHNLNVLVDMLKRHFKDYPYAIDNSDSDSDNDSGGEVSAKKMATGWDILSLKQIRLTPEP